MIKKLSIFGILAIILFTGFLIYGNSQKETKKILGSENTAKKTRTTPPTNLIELNIKGQNLLIAWSEIGSPENLVLIPNFSEKLLSIEAKEKYGCKFISNAGFYSKDAKPIGLFIHDGNSLGSWQKNRLFDGVLSINDMEVPRITRNQPVDHLKIGLQAGPIIKENGIYLNLSQTLDTLDRRVLASVTGGNKLFFLVIYSKDSVFSGPTISDLPEVVGSFENITGIIFADTLNFDGGTASTFSVENTNLPEVTPVGSFFCLKS